MASLKRTPPHLGSRTAPLIIAHRGCSDAAPENSMAAFRLAVREQAHMIELDVRLSSDQQFVVFHDKRLDRTSSGSGQLKKFTADELTVLDNGSWFSKKYSSEKIPLLRDVVPLTKQGVLLDIEIKPDVSNRHPQATAELAVDTVRRARITQRIIFSSFNHRLMAEIKKIAPEITTAILYNPIKNFRRPPSQLGSSTGADIFICSKYQMNAEVVADAHKSGMKVYVYGISSERDVKRSVRIGIEGLISNDPGMVRESLDGIFTNQQR